MSNIRMVKNKIDSITNTKKITRTMEMIAISKMRKSKMRLLSIKPYVQVINNICFNILKANLKYQHFLLQDRKIIKNVAIVVMSSNKGLCGNLNNQIFHKVITMIHDYHTQKVRCHLYIFGIKGFLFFSKQNISCVKEYIPFEEDIKYYEIINLSVNLLKKYKNALIDKLLIVSNVLYQTVSTEINILQLLPLSINNIKNKLPLIYKNWDYLYEPDSVLVLDVFFKKYVLFQIFQCILENIVCEQFSRMVIMKNATDNSETVIKELNVIYNKTRQFNITQELIEIIAGSSVV